MEVVDKMEKWLDDSVAENILNKNTKNIKTNKVILKPCNTTVIVEFYEDNPYRLVETLDNGLILGIESTKRYRSNETGEMEDNDECICCAKVIAVGPDCKNVKEGEDVFCVKHIANPVPFRKKGYWSLNEQNIICRMIDAETC